MSESELERFYCHVIYVQVHIDACFYWSFYYNFKRGFKKQEMMSDVELL